MSHSFPACYALPTANASPPPAVCGGLELGAHQRGERGGLWLPLAGQRSLPGAQVGARVGRLPLVQPASICLEGPASCWVGCCWLWGSTSTCALELCRRAGVQAIYSGHDHRNSFAGELDGVRLAYG